MMDSVTAERISEAEAVQRAVLVMLPRLEYGDLKDIAAQAGMDRHSLYYRARKELRKLGRHKKEAAEQQTLPSQTSPSQRDSGAVSPQECTGPGALRS